MDVVVSMGGVLTVSTARVSMGSEMTGDGTLVLVDHGTPKLPSVLERNENVVNIYLLHLLKSKETRGSSQMVTDKKKNLAKTEQHNYRW